MIACVLGGDVSHDPCDLPHPELADACLLARMGRANGALRGPSHAPLEPDDCVELQSPGFRSMCESSAAIVLARSAPVFDAPSLLARVEEQCGGIVLPVYRSACTFGTMEASPATIDSLDPVTWIELCRGPASPMLKHCLGHGVVNWMSAMVGPSSAKVWFSRPQLNDQVAAMEVASRGVGDEEVQVLHTLMYALIRVGGGTHLAGMRPISNGDFAEECQRLVGCSELVTGELVRWGEPDMAIWWATSKDTP
jgi:hypothetical protein